MWRAWREHGAGVWLVAVVLIGCFGCLVGCCAADLGLARIYKEPIKALSDVERVVVTLWYRAPELLLGAKHYTKAVDLWAVGCIFVELINTRELFCGKEVEGSNAPFQKDQLDKIFKVLGMPTPQAWEGLENLPEYHHVVQMGRERKYPTQSELKNAVKVGPGRAGAALLDLLSRLLEYGDSCSVCVCVADGSCCLLTDLCLGCVCVCVVPADPETRITAKEALEHEYFTEIVRLVVCFAIVCFAVEVTGACLTWLRQGAGAARLGIRRAWQGAHFFSHANCGARER